MGKMESLKENERNALLELKKIIKFKDKDFKNTDSGHVYELKLSKKKLERIPEAINELTYLKKLDLEKNKLTKIENLDKLVNLTELKFYENRIEKIEGLDNLVELEELNFGFNEKLSKIEGLKNLVKLKILEFTYNQITKIEGLESLSHLEKLWLSSNKITRIEGLEGLSHLRTLTLNGNKITRIEGLDDLESLNYFDLDKKHLEKADKKIYEAGLYEIKRAISEKKAIENEKKEQQIQADLKKKAIENEKKRQMEIVSDPRKLKSEVIKAIESEKLNHARELVQLARKMKLWKNPKIERILNDLGVMIKKKRQELMDRNERRRREKQKAEQAQKEKRRKKEKKRKAYCNPRIMCTPPCDPAACTPIGGTYMGPPP